MSCSTHSFIPFRPRNISYNAETDSKSFGGDATHLGPRIISHKKIENRYSTTYHYHFEHKNRATVSMDIDEKLSESEIRISDMENGRRMMTERISDAILNTQAEKKQDTVIIVPDPKGHPPTTRPPDDKEIVSCPRYQEIRSYLLRNRNELALDTMNFKMPDHILLAHILNNGFLVIDYDEWTAFLIVAHRAKDLFSYVLFLPSFHRHWVIKSYDTITTGHITRIPNGWPTIPKLSKKAPAPIGDDVVRAFNMCSKRIENRLVCFHDDYLDFDIEEFHYYLNRHLDGNNLKKQFSALPQGFSRDDIQILLEWCSYMNKFTYV